MKTLVIGSGGREHAIAWKLAQSTQVETVFVAPGNAGTAMEAKVQNISANSIDDYIQFAQDNQIALTVVGPEAPLAEGIVDQFTAAGLACFGPCEAAAQLETSKAFSKDFMQEYSIPTAAYQRFTDAALAHDYLQTQSYPLVIKADGLAAGKGVVIASTLEEATDAVNDMMANKKFGSAGNEIVIEAFLQGEEASFMVITDGKTILPLATSQDHKARDDGDKGPNTGGMGAYSPAPIVTESLHEKVMQTVIVPTLEGLRQRGITYKGFLYAGLMITQQGDINVLEFNCRLGDPETQVILPRLQSDLAEVCLATVENRLDNLQLQWDPSPCLGVVLAAKGYPGSYAKGEPIGELPEYADGKIFHAGTSFNDKNLVTNGGRVLCVTTIAENVAQAQKRAYSIIDEMDTTPFYFRQDIGSKAITTSDA